MRIVVDTSTVIAVIAGEAGKARLLELTKDATIVAPPLLIGKSEMLFLLC
jgi:uncharacterized protein with PIN domain